MWQAFIKSYCTAQFLCYHGEPHWMGWVVMVGGSLLVLRYIVDVMRG